jgi:hypothetical protein
MQKLPFLLPLIVLGDMCQDFCIEQLGLAGCESFCDKDNLCDGLFWSDNDMTDVSLHIRDYQVLCSDAFARIRSTFTHHVQLEFPALRAHPHVKISFENEGRNHSAVFDTGSDISYAMIETAYSVDPRPLRGTPMSLWYGFSGQVREFESIGTIDETIRLYSDDNQFVFHEPHLHMIAPPGDRIGVLVGAQPGSAFATTAEFFAVVPGETKTLPWSLLIGHNTVAHVHKLCPRISWFDRIMSSPFWLIPSTVSLESRYAPPGQPQVFTEHLRLAIDTGGGDRVLISPAMMEDVVAVIEAFGPRRIRSEKPFPIFKNCSRASFSEFASGIHLRFQPGAGVDDVFTGVAFKLSDYVEFFGVDYCTLLWKIGLIPNTEDIIIGTQFLRNVITVFDNIENRVGFCK